MLPEGVGIGIIGTGFGATVQLPAFMQIDGAHVIGIASAHPEKSKELAALHALPQSFTSADALIACPEIRLVSIATPPSSHAELVRKVIAAGKAVLCEKPFTLDAKTAEELLQLAEARKIVHAIDFEFRELEAWKVLYEHMAGGAIGRVQSIELSWNVGSWADPQRRWTWQCDRDAGGGVITALGIHLFDAAEWLAGPMRSVRSRLTVSIPKRPDVNGTARAVTAEDTAEIDMQSVGGIPVSIRISNVEKDGKGLGMRIVGERGELVLESASQDYASGLTVRKDTNVLFENRTDGSGDARIAPFRSLATRLIRSVSIGDATFRPSFVEGLRSERIRDAVFASAASEDWAEVL